MNHFYSSKRRWTTKTADEDAERLRETPLHDNTQQWNHFDDSKLRLSEFVTLETIVIQSKSILNNE